MKINEINNSDFGLGDKNLVQPRMIFPLTVAGKGNNIKRRSFSAVLFATYA